MAAENSIGYGLAVLSTLVEYLESNLEGLSPHEVALALAQAQKAGAYIEGGAQQAGLLDEHEIMGVAAWIGIPSERVEVTQ